jgi:proteasome-associated ATPase
MTTPEPPELNRGELIRLLAQNDQRGIALATAKALLQQQQEEIASLHAAPNTIGVYLRRGLQDGTVIVSASGRELRVEAHKALLNAGDVVVLNENMQIIAVEAPVSGGSVMSVKDTLEDGRVIAVSGSDTEIVLERSETLAKTRLASGQYIRVDPKAGLVLELLSQRDETRNLLLEEVPDISYTDIGGLEDQLAEIHDSVELPFLHADLFKKYRRPAPRGVLLYGPPGCGKTLVAKAVANSLAKRVGGKAHFINIKGPELLNKWVGETERMIRVVFDTAREKAAGGDPVVIFFDEMESMFRQRGAGISSDMESTIVPQLLSEMDGVEELSNVIVIGASNRQDLIDPAILRPGRLDVKIEVGRPDQVAAKKIFSIYLTDDLPIRTDVRGGAEYLVHKVSESMYRAEKETEFLEVTYVNGVKEVMHFSDFASGAMIQSIVNRAKTSAIKDEIAGKGEGITLEHLKQAVVDEFRETEDLPNTTNPDDWAKIAGKKGERIANVRGLLRAAEEKDTYTEVVLDRQYL